MNLYLIEQRDSITDTVIFDYDEIHSVVVAAPTPREARLEAKLAAEGREDTLSDAHPEYWTQPRWTQIKWLGTARHTIRQGVVHQHIHFG